MPLSQIRAPRSHRALRTRRHAGAATAAAVGRRALRRPPLLSARGGPHPGALAAAALAALVSLGVAARAGALTHLWDFLDYGAGVLSLVSLTSAVLWGLAATDRTLFASGHRLAAQGAHRGLAVAGLGFLALHVWVKVAESHTTATAVVVPFADPDQALLIGLGTLAGYLFVAVAVSGAVRSAFATKGRSMWWRALHMGAYPAWGASLVHGLKSGRPASGWVTVAYALCLIGVAGVLALRLRGRLRAAPAQPARAAAAPAPAASGSPGEGPGAARSFVHQPAERPGDRLAARLAGRTEGPGSPQEVRVGPPAPLAPPAPPAPLTPPAPSAPLTPTMAAAPVVAGRTAPAPMPVLPWPEPQPYEPAFGVVGRVAGTDRPVGPLDGIRGLQ
ncbi:hypothetical protein ACFWAR_29765 [Streptomyces sp. NPDC059917]|uniref:hypothetical protein n=1 Tax=Streptomyces sp. NPDC059917 TaxID=3347002 RepID=UPI003664DE33